MQKIPGKLLFFVELKIAAVMKKVAPFVGQETEQKNAVEFILPKWLRYAILIAALVGLIATAFKAGAPSRNDFPPHVPPTVK